MARCGTVVAVLAAVLVALLGTPPEVARAADFFALDAFRDRWFVPWTRQARTAGEGGRVRVCASVSAIGVRRPPVWRNRMVAKVLKWLVLLMGIACVAIGSLHFLLGVDSVPGEAGAGATVDSRERFYGAIFLGYGLAWLWAARQTPIPSRAVRWLAGIFLLGGIGRVVSLLVHGPPQGFQLVLTVVELGLPPVFLWLATVDEKTRTPITGTDSQPRSRRTRA